MHNKLIKEFEFPKKDSSGRPDAKYGCLICGAKNDALEYAGTERAHIFADGTVSNLPWNIIPLCPRCHQAFDSIIKPYIANAFQFASEGFLQNPLDGNTFKAATALPDLLRLLREVDPKESEEPNKRPETNAGKESVLPTTPGPGVAHP